MVEGTARGQETTVSSVGDAFGAQPWSARIVTRWGHHGAHVLIVVILAAIALRVYPPPMTSAIALLLPVALVALVLISWVLMRKHDRGLCEHCLASMPLDASAAAARYRRRFQVSHLGSNKPVVLTYLAVLIGSNFLPGTLGLIGWAVMQSTMIYLVLSYATHRRLQPWCPWCSDGGGGTEQVFDGPDLPRGRGRQLV
jgi:hypothetical protein